MKIVSADLGAIEHFLIEVELLNDDGEYSYFIKMTIKQDQLTHFCITKTKFTERIKRFVDISFILAPFVLLSDLKSKL